jgi:hypothetical protein
LLVAMAWLLARWLLDIDQRRRLFLIWERGLT